MASSPSSQAESLSTLDIALGLIIPLSCICITLSAVIINMIRLRRPGSLKQAEQWPEDGKVELPGDMVEMFVELDGWNGEVVKKERGKAKELDGTMVGSVRAV